VGGDGVLGGDEYGVRRRPAACWGWSGGCGSAASTKQNAEGRWSPCARLVIQPLIVTWLVRERAGPANEEMRAATIDDLVL
jgi:hypothetical protein